MTNINTTTPAVHQPLEGSTPSPDNMLIAADDERDTVLLPTGPLGLAGLADKLNVTGKAPAHMPEQAERHLAIDTLNALAVHLRPDLCLAAFLALLVILAMELFKVIIMTTRKGNGPAATNDRPAKTHTQYTANFKADNTPAASAKAAVHTEPYGCTGTQQDRVVKGCGEAYSASKLQYDKHGHTQHQPRPNDGLGPVSCLAEKEAMAQYLPALADGEKFLNQIGGAGHE